MSPIFKGTSIIIIFQSCWPHGFLLFSIVIYINRLEVSPLDCIQCPRSTDVYKSLLVNQHWRVNCTRITKRTSPWCSSILFSSNVHPVLFVLLREKERSDAQKLFDGCCLQDLSKYYVVHLCSSHPPFFPNVSLESWWCNRTLVLT